MSQGVNSGEPIFGFKDKDVLHELDSTFGHFSEVAFVKTNGCFFEFRVRSYREFLASEKGFFLFFG